MYWPTTRFDFCFFPVFFDLRVLGGDFDLEPPGDRDLDFDLAALFLFFLLLRRPLGPCCFFFVVRRLEVCKE